MKTIVIIFNLESIPEIWKYINNYYTQKKVFHVIEINMQNSWGHWRAWINVWLFVPVSKKNGEHGKKLF